MRYPRDLQVPFLAVILTYNPYESFKTRRSRWRWKLCRQSWRHKETIGTGCIAQFITPSRDITKHWFLCIQQAVTRTSITAMPSSILRISIWNLDLGFKLHVPTWKPAFFLCFFRRVVVSFVFFSDRCVGHMSYLSENNTKLKGGLSFCWFMIIVSKKHIRVCPFERS